MALLASWSGLISARQDRADLTLTGLPPNVAASITWSATFRAFGDDGNDYFVKTLEACPPGQGASIAIEFIVAKVGLLIGAPMCVSRVVQIPSLLAGWEFRPGMVLGATLAHASQALEHADENGRPNLISRSQDDNARRQAGIYALYDWAFGCDAQWLYDIDRDRQIFSHDHGLYFPPQGHGSVDIAELQSKVNVANQLPDPPVGLLPAAVQDVAGALMGVTQNDLLGILSNVPLSWPISDADLEAIGWFLHERRDGVATRLLAMKI